MDSLLNIAKVLCYLGSSLSALIALRLAKIEKLTFLNKMFFIYFILDFVFGSMESYLLFKVYRDRWKYFSKFPLI